MRDKPLSHSSTLLRVWVTNNANMCTQLKISIIPTENADRKIDRQTRRREDRKSRQGQWMFRRTLNPSEFSTESDAVRIPGQCWSDLGRISKFKINLFNFPTEKSVGIPTKFGFRWNIPSENKKFKVFLPELIGGKIQNFWIFRRKNPSEFRRHIPSEILL